MSTEANNPADAGLAETGSAQTDDDISTEAFDRAPAPDDDDPADPPETGEDTGEAGDETDKPETEEADEDEGEAALIEYESEDGQKFKVPAALKDHLLRRDDYTRKTQEVAAQRREIEEQAKARETEFAQKAESLEAFRAEHTKVAVLETRHAELAEQAETFRKIDWQAFREQDPDRYEQYRDRQRAVRDALLDTEEALKGAKTDLQTKEAERLTKQQAEAVASLAKQRQETGRVLAAEVPGWNAARVTQVVEFMHGDLGIPHEEIAETVDPRTWKMVDRLMKAEAENAALKKAQKQQQTADRHEKAQGSKPAATTRGTGATARDPSTARGDGLSMDEWKRRRAAQKGIKLR